MMNETELQEFMLKIDFIEPKKYRIDKLDEGDEGVED